MVPTLTSASWILKTAKKITQLFPKNSLPHLSPIFWLLVLTGAWYQHPGVLFCQEESLFHSTK